MRYDGGCSKICVAGSATVGNSISGVSCCTTSFCNASIKIKASETMISLVLIATILTILRVFID